MTTATLKLTPHDVDRALDYFEAKNAFTTGPVEVSNLLKEKKNGFLLIDVRAKDDFAKGHLPGALNLPKEQWSAAQGLRKDKTNILYCYSQACHLGSKAAAEFAAKGFPVMEMEGGYETWISKGLTIEH